MQLLSNGKFEPIRFNPTTYPALLAGGWTFGKSGLTTAGIIQYTLPDLLILAAGKIVVEMSGTNDVLLAVSSATTVANRVAMWEAMTAAGITVIPCEVPPTPDSTNQTTTDALNALLKVEAEALGLQWIEWPATLYDGAVGDADLFEVDEIHPNPAGCRIMGAHVLAEIDRLISDFPFEFPASGAADWITANPYMTGGTTIATGWSTPTAYPSATVTPSLVTIDGRQWQRLTVTQSGAECKLAVFNLTGQAVTAGDRVRILAKLKVSAGFKNVRVKLTFNGPGGEIAALEAIDDGQNMTSADYTVTLPAHEGTWLSPPELVPTGATSATLSVWSFGAGTVDIGICGVIEA
jgi:lysophospholipase L1-like esterase